MISEIEVAGRLEPDELERRCRSATAELNRDLDALEQHLSASIGDIGPDNPSLAMSLYSGLLWVRQRRLGRLEHALALIAERA